MSVWKDPGSRGNFVSVAIILLIGFAEQPQDLVISVENGNLLKVEVAWPQFLADGVEMHRKLIQGNSNAKIAKYHPRIMSF